MPLKEKSIVVPQSPFLYYLIQYQSFGKAGKNWEKYLYCQLARVKDTMQLKFKDIKVDERKHTSLLRSSGGPSLCRQACATLITCSSLRGCSSILAARNRQQGAKAYMYM